jgi:hypothetical protein
MRRRLATALVALLAGGAVAGVVVPAAATAPPPPGRDPFYRYTGTAPLGAIRPGTVLKERAVQVAIGQTSTPVKAEQLLYRTSGELGQPTVTVTTVIQPVTMTVLPRIVDYLSFYDALGAQCDPSYTLAGGNPGAANQQQTEEEEALISGYVADDNVVTVPDFEGEHLDWTAGYEAGYGALDAVRATESYLHLPVTTDVGLTGYSGGSIAAEWASELAPRYAPALHIVGVAAGGIPVDYAHNLRYINGSPGWSGIIPAALVGLTRAYQVDLTPYLDAYGRTLVGKVQQACIGSFYGAYPGLRIQQLLKPQYRNVFAIPAFVQIMNDLIMGSVPGHPRGPLFLAVGNADGTGDGVMVAADVEALAYEYCHQGVPVQFAEYSGANHDQAAVHFEPAAVQFLDERFAGVPFSSNCASVPRGDSIAPLPMPGRSRTQATSQRRSRTSARVAAYHATAASLANTGSTPGLPVVGVLLAGAALIVGRRLRRS